MSDKKQEKLNFNMNFVVNPDEKVEKFSQMMDEYMDNIVSIGYKLDLYDVKKDNKYGIDCPSDIDSNQDIGHIYYEKYNKYQLTVYDALKELMIESNRRKYIEQMVDMATKAAVKIESSILPKGYVQYNPYIFANIFYNEYGYDLYESMLFGKESIKLFFGENSENSDYWLKLYDKYDLNKLMIPKDFIEVAIKQYNRKKGIKKCYIIAIIVLLVLFLLFKIIL